MRRNRVRPFELLTVLTVTIACFLYTSQVPAAITAKLTPAEDGIELEFTGEGGSAVKETIPVYHAWTVRYFSAETISRRARSHAASATPVKSSASK